VNAALRLTPLRRLQLLLVLVALHSVGVGIGLMWHPAALLAWCGFRPVGETFFIVQGGVFHIVMALAYSLAAWDPVRQERLIVFSVLVKLMATVFLMSYWSLIARVPTILASGLVDGAMAVVMVAALRAWRRDARAGGA
jgi:hypothetical protein